MNFLDIILVIPIVVLAIAGYKKGLIKEIASLAALILGIYFAVYFSDYVARFLLEKFDFNERYVFIIAFIITFIGVVLLVSLIGKLLDKVAKFAALGIVNKLLGLVFGIVKGILIMSILVLLFNLIDNKTKILKDDIREGSLLYKPLSRVAPLIIYNLKNIDIKKPSFDDLDDKVKEVELDKIV